ncbi:MAG: alpha/beta hydrolase [Myxococcota bacterium]
MASNPTPSLAALGLHAAGDFARLAFRRLTRGPARTGWSWKVEIARTLMYETLMRSKERGIPWLRAAQEALPARSDFLAEVAFTEVDAGGVAASWCVPRASRPERTVVYIHGGGYVVGSVASYQPSLARLAVSANARVLAVDYRLAPEHPFPAAQDDCLAAVRFALADGAAPERLALAGDSAGGALALATLCALRDAGLPRPAAGVLISPWVDPFASGGSIEANAPCDVLDRELAVIWAENATSAGDRQDPRFALLGAELRGLPPLLIQVAKAEILLDQGLDLAHRAREAGVEVELEEWDDMFHVFQIVADLLDEGAAAWDAISRFLRTRLPAGD